MVEIRLVSKSLPQCRANQSGEQSFAWFHSRRIYKSRLLPLAVRCYPYIAYFRWWHRLLARPGERSERDHLQAVRLSRSRRRTWIRLVSHGNGQGQWKRVRETVRTYRE